MNPVVKVVVAPALLRALPEEPREVRLSTGDFETDLGRLLLRSLSLQSEAAASAARAHVYAPAREAARRLDAGRAVQSWSTLPLRAGLAACFALLTVGLLVSSYALTTGADNLVRGLATVLLWSGQAAAAIGAHLHGLRSGSFIFTERWSQAVVVFAVGMIIVASIATVEFSVR